MLELVMRYQVIAKKLFDCKCQQSKKCLSILSGNVLPSAISQLTMTFVAKSEKDKIEDSSFHHQ